MSVVYLMCGGGWLGSPTPKPLQDFGSGRPLLVDHYHQTEASFDRVVCMVERSHLAAFERVREEYSLEKISMTQTADHSSTADKFSTILEQAVDTSLLVSYPDIFAPPKFWGALPESRGHVGGLSVMKTPITSRFPRVYGEMFSSSVKGVSDYRSPRPANPHFIFAGLMLVDVDPTRELWLEYAANQTIGSLEVGFLDYAANHGALSAEAYYGDWFHIDSHRDYRLMSAVLVDV